MYSNFLVHAPNRVFSFHFAQFVRSVLVQELIDAQVAAANSDIDLLVVNAHMNTPRPELVNSLGLAKEHNFQFLALRVVVDVLSKSQVNVVVLDRDINRDSLLQVDDCLLQVLVFSFSVL